MIDFLEMTGIIGGLTILGAAGLNYLNKNQSQNRIEHFSSPQLGQPLKLANPDLQGFKNTDKYTPVNVEKNIIEGPGGRKWWNHSPKMEEPMLTEEGPWPVQGNIGVLVRNEAIDNWSICGGPDPTGGSPNCSGVFVPDEVQTANTCTNCDVTGPSSYGANPYGIPDGEFVTAHGLQVYGEIVDGKPTNKRAAAAGEGPASLGCYENIPALEKAEGKNTCFINEQKQYRTVGYWPNLPEYQSLTQVKFNNNPPAYTEGFSNDAAPIDSVGELLNNRSGNLHPREPNPANI